MLGLAWTARVALGPRRRLLRSDVHPPGWRGFRCGIFFAAQEVDAIPFDAWDLPLDAVVTEREVWVRDG